MKFKINSKILILCFFVLIFGNSSNFTSSKLTSDSVTNSITGTVDIGVLVPITGSISSFTPEFLDGVKASALKINESINFQFDVHLVIEDTGSNPSQTDSAYNALKAKGVELIIGPVTSTNSLAIVEQVTIDKIPLISYSATSSLLSNSSYSYFFRTIPSDSKQSIALSELLYYLSHKNIVIVYQNDSYGQNLRTSVNSEFTNLGGNVLNDLIFQPGDTNFSSIVTNISSISSVDGIMFLGLAAERQSFITQIRQSGNDVPIYVSDLVDTQALASNPLADRIIGIQTRSSKIGDPVYDEFLADIVYCNSIGLCTFGNNPGIFSNYAYDAMMVGAMAIRLSSEYNGTLIKDNIPIAGKSYIGATGNKTFTAVGDPFYAEYEYWQIQGSSSHLIGEYVLNTISLNNNFLWQYKPHSPVFVNSNNQFISQGFRGSGTQFDPYVFEGYALTSAIGDLIAISGTTEYFVIKNNKLNGLNSPNFGINLNAVHNGLIVDNEIFNMSQDGIRFSSSNSDIEVVNNSIYDNGWHGIYAKSSTKLYISNNEVKNNNFSGIRFEFTDFSLIKENEITNSGSGVDLESSGFNNILANVIFNNNQLGIWLNNSDNNELDANIIYNNSELNNIQVWGGIHNWYSNNNSIVNNEIFDNRGAGLVTYESNLITVEQNNVYRNLHNGIGIDHTNLSIIRENFIEDSNGGGLVLYESYENKIESNNISNNNQSGIFQTSSDYNLIISNSITDNHENGIFFDFSDDFNSILSNFLFNNHNSGMLLLHSENNTVNANDVANNRGWSGIEIIESSNHKIKNNYIHDNQNGIVLSGSYGTTIEFNEIFHNTDVGIRINGPSTFNEIKGNVLYYPGEHNLLFEDGESKNNNVLGNDLGGGFFDTTAIDDSTANYYSGNFWSVWSHDDPFEITGQAGSEDVSPTLNANHLEVPEFDSYEIVEDNQVTVRWFESSDSFGHEFSYSLSYSMNNGTTWINIKSGLHVNDFDWDTTGLNIKQGVMIKIEVIDEVGFVSSSTFVIPSTNANTTTDSINSTDFNFSLFTILAILITLLVRKKRVDKKL